MNKKNTLLSTQFKFLLFALLLVGSSGFAQDKIIKRGEKH